MSDAQNKTETEHTNTDDKVLMDEVAEDRPDMIKKSGFTGFVMSLILLGGIAGAGWYYQGMWLPQVQNIVKQTQIKSQQAQAWLNDLLSFGKEPEQVAAPASKAEPSKASKESSKPNYIVAAVPDPAPVVDKESLDVVAGNSHVVKNEEPSIEPSVATVDAVGVKKSSSIIEDPGIVAAKALEPIVKKEAEVVAPKIVVGESTKIKSIMESPAIVTKRSAVNLIDARQAFWQRDLPRAEALYKVQINNAEATADSWGELGNVYYLQAKWQQAATAYTEAALILLNKGDFPQAMFLRYIVMGLNPAQAQRIDEHLKTLQAPLHG